MTRVRGASVYLVVIRGPPGVNLLRFMQPSGYPADVNRTCRLSDTIKLSRVSATDWRDRLMLNWLNDCEVVALMYPYMTFEDGTEVVHSNLIVDGDSEKVIVHFERPTTEGFDSARCELPSRAWTDWEGHFTQSEKRAFEECLSNYLSLVRV